MGFYWLKVAPASEFGQTMTEVTDAREDEFLASRILVTPAKLRIFTHVDFAQLSHTRRSEGSITHLRVCDIFRFSDPCHCVPDFFDGIF